MCSGKFIFSLSGNHIMNPGIQREVDELGTAPSQLYVIPKVRNGV